MTAAFNLSQLANNLNTSGQLDATDGLSGLIANANLASSGTASSSTYLRGDRTWATLAQKVVQIKLAQNLDIATVSAGTAYTALSASITPTSSSNPILMIYQLTGACGGSHDLANFYFTRNGTRVAVGNASGSATRATGKFITYAGTQIGSYGGLAYDNPGSTSALTYNLVAQDENSDVAIWINRGEDGTAGSNTTATASFLALMEVSL